MNYANEAVKIITGDRHESYGHPGDDLGGIALMWSGLLNTRLSQPLTGKDVAHKPKPDNLIDAHGYLLCAEWMQTGIKPEITKELVK